MKLHYNTFRSSADTKIKNYECICAFTCSTRKQMKSHIDSHRYATKCEICKKRSKFTNKKELIVHFEKHNLDTCVELFECEICEKEFNSLYILNQHKQNKRHSNTLGEDVIEETANYISIGNGPASDWSDSVSSEKERDSPLTVAKTTETDSPFQCKACNLVFDDKLSLTVHRKSFHYLTTYQCSFCGSLWTQRKRLLEHEKAKHSDDKLPLKCNRCPKRFAYMTGLKRHQMIHDDIRPHVCEICGKAFRIKGKLRVHSHIHSGEKPYGCNYPNCDKKFSDPSSLIAHKKRHTVLR